MMQAHRTLTLVSHDATEPASAASADPDRNADLELQRGGRRFGELRAGLIDVLNGSGPDIAMHPVEHIQSGRTVGFEALSRFPGPCPTAEWYRVAHALGVGDDLELRALDRALELVDQAPSSDGTAPFFGVNVSPQTLLDPRLAERLDCETARRVVIELTEQTLLPRLSVLRTHLGRLRELGVRIALQVSSFHASSLRCLAVSQPDFVKFGVDLTTSLTSEHRDSQMVDGLLARCRHQGVFVIAVGVEQRRHVHELQELGIDAMQGYFVGEPVVLAPVA